MKEYKGAICRGSYILGSACGQCEKCEDELESLRQMGRLSEIHPKYLQKAVEPKSVLENVRTIIEECSYVADKGAVCERRVCNYFTLIEKLKSKFGSEYFS